MSMADSETQSRLQKDLRQSPPYHLLTFAQNNVCSSTLTYRTVFIAPVLKARWLERGRLLHYSLVNSVLLCI